MVKNKEKGKKTFLFPTQAKANSKWGIKDIIETAGVIIALILSGISIFQNNKTLNIEQQPLEVKMQVSVEELPTARIQYVPFPQGDSEPFPGTYGFIQMPIVVNIDNLSLRKVSIRSINATPILRESDTKDGTPFFTNGEVVTTDFSKPFKRVTDNGLMPVSLPFTLDQGDSISLLADIGWPLDKASSDLIMRDFIPSFQNPVLVDLKMFLEKNEKTLGRAKIILGSHEGTILPFAKYSEPSRLIYRIDVVTSFNTRYSAYLDPSTDIVVSDSKWDLLMEEY